MQKIKKIFAFLMSLVLLMSMVGSYSSINTQAAGRTNYNLTVRMTGAGTARILSGNTNVTKKIVRVEAGDHVTFAAQKNKIIKSVTYKSSNKKVMTVTKKGKVSIKKNGTARITVTLKRKNGKSVSSWVKLRVAGQNPSENQPFVNDSQNLAENSGQNPSGTPSGSTGRSLVLYFSRSGENYNVGTVEKGSTQIVAERIASETGADLFKLETVRTYPENYMECVTVTQEEKNADVRPELRAVPQNLSEYHYIYLGYPIWHADMPMALYTFLETYDLSGKTILPFCTHAGSGLAGTVEAIRGKCQGAAVMDGFEISGTTVQNDTAVANERVREWLQTSGVPKNTDQQSAGNTSTGTGEFNLTNATVTLNNGMAMPVLGIGTYRLSDIQAENSVYWALRDGYRLIDTARIYGNETGVGRGIKRAVDEGIVSREEIFVTTKMWTSDYEDGDSAVAASLRRLGLDYIDLMILHHSQPGSDVQAYKAMERAVSAGKLRSIGLSNYYTPQDFDRLVNATTITPVLLQNETHPYHQSIQMKEHLKQYGTVMESWFPLGGRGNTQTLFNDPVISGIADVHGKTSAQVILRWHLQAGNIAIPGSSNEAHIQENFEIFDFALTDEEMERMSSLERNERFSGY